jgi:hypothetical protein
MNVGNSQIFPLFFLAVPLYTAAKTLSNFKALKREAERGPDGGSGEQAGLVGSVS